MVEQLLLLELMSRLVLPALPVTGSSKHPGYPARLVGNFRIPAHPVLEEFGLELWKR